MRIVSRQIDDAAVWTPSGSARPVLQSNEQLQRAQRVGRRSRCVPRTQARLEGGRSTRVSWTERFGAPLRAEPRRSKYWRARGRHVYGASHCSRNDGRGKNLGSGACELSGSTRRAADDERWVEDGREWVWAGLKNMIRYSVLTC